MIPCPARCIVHWPVCYNEWAATADLQLAVEGGVCYRTRICSRRYDCWAFVHFPDDACICQLNSPGFAAEGLTYPGRAQSADATGCWGGRECTHVQYQSTYSKRKTCRSLPHQLADLSCSTHPLCCSARVQFRRLQFHADYVRKMANQGIRSHMRPMAKRWRQVMCGRLASLGNPWAFDMGICEASVTAPLSSWAPTNALEAVLRNASPLLWTCQSDTL